MWAAKLRLFLTQLNLHLESDLLNSENDKKMSYTGATTCCTTCATTRPPGKLWVVEECPLIDTPINLLTL